MSSLSDAEPGAYIFIRYPDGRNYLKIGTGSTAGPSCGRSSSRAASKPQLSEGLAPLAVAEDRDGNAVVRGCQRALRSPSPPVSEENLATPFYIDQLRRDANAVAAPSDAVFEQ